jgi:hypothetical protein
VAWRVGLACGAGVAAGVASGDCALSVAATASGDGAAWLAAAASGDWVTWFAGGASGDCPEVSGADPTLSGELAGVPARAAPPWIRTAEVGRASAASAWPGLATAPAATPATAASVAAAAPILRRYGCPVAERGRREDSTDENRGRKAEPFVGRGGCARRAPEPDRPAAWRQAGADVTRDRAWSCLGGNHHVLGAFGYGCERPRRPGLCPKTGKRGMN